MPEDVLLKDLRRRMDGALEVLRKEFGGLRTGRASAISLARENGIPILVFSIFENGGFAKVLRGCGRYTIIGQPG